MKRLITLLLAMVMALSFVVPAWAESANLTNQQDQTSTNQEVKVQIVKSDPVYKVSVTWNSLTFTYTQGEWFPDAHQYTNAQWSNPATITVNNHSNAPIWFTAEISNNSAEGFESVLVELKNSEDQALGSNRIEVDPCPVNATSNIPSKDFKVAVSGAPTKHSFELTTIRTLTVQIFTSQNP